MRYILWVLALLEACEVTINYRHLEFYQNLEIRFKPLKKNFVVLCMKPNT